MSERAYDERTWKKVCDVHKEVEELKTTVVAYVAEQKQICRQQCAEVERIKIALDGNGKRGIKKDVSWLVDREHSRQRFFVAVVTFLAANIGSIIYSITLLRRAAALLLVAEGQ